MSTNLPPVALVFKSRLPYASRSSISVLQVAETSFTLYIVFSAAELGELDMTAGILVAMSCVACSSMTADKKNLRALRRNNSTVRALCFIPVLESLLSSEHGHDDPFHAHAERTFVI